MKLSFVGAGEVDHKDKKVLDGKHRPIIIPLDSILWRGGAGGGRNIQER
jgi:hypothetical protein